MFFSKLPDNVKDAIHGLVTDQVFQNTFGHDPVLNELDDEKNSFKETFTDLIATLNYKVRYKEKTYNHLTPLAWTYLWCAESPIVRSANKEVTNADIDFFFYVLENGVSDIDIKDALIASHDFCAKNEMSYEDAIDVAHLVITKAFAPLRMFPQNLSQQKTAAMAVFDSDWLTALISKVHTVTGYAPEHIMKKLSLTACCYYYAQYARMQGVEHIEKRPPEEILIAQDARCCELILDRLEELKVIKHEDRAGYFKIMTTIPEK